MLNYGGKSLKILNFKSTLDKVGSQYLRLGRKNSSKDRMSSLHVKLDTRFGVCRPPLKLKRGVFLLEGSSASGGEIISLYEMCRNSNAAAGRSNYFPSQ
jgi:hypothetical protein